ncbi:MAG: hypothetical protein WD651_00395 [Acidimicrobiia bacterium]
MQLSVAGCLSQQQNRLFSSLMDQLAAKLGFEVVVTTPETAHIVYMCGLPTGLTLDRLAPWVGPVMNDISTSRPLDENLRKEATELMVSLHQDVAGRQRLEEFGISHLARVDEAPYRSLGESVSDLDPRSPDSDVA